MSCTVLRLSRACLKKESTFGNVTRSLVSQAFLCNDAWSKRLEAPIFQKIRLGEYFVELDKKFTNENRGSAIDVDIFAQAASSPSECEQLEELLYKLRRTPHTSHSPESTGHATVRALIVADKHKEGGEQIQHLVKMLDDRINYGLFLDEYTTILLLDQLLEEGRLVEGARVASHIMLQEENIEGLGALLGNLACWRYIKTGQESWFYEGEVPVDDNPDEVIRVRVKGMVPNNYQDDHFDIREPSKILGKTLWYINCGEDDVSKSLKALGLVLWGKDDLIKNEGTFKIVEEVRKILLDKCSNTDTTSFLERLEGIEVNIDEHLIEQGKESFSACEASMISTQVQKYENWNKLRARQLEEEYQILLNKSRKEAILQIKDDLAKEEEKLFFFENFDRLEQEKEEKDQAWRRTFPRKNWRQKDWFRRDKYIPKPGQERKTARWERREAKMGPAK